ncbi:MAG: F0F1 ATP synthase subunit B [Pseudomonadota bacterium]
MTEHAFYLDPEFWVAAAFFMFFVFAGKPLVAALTKMLDDRSSQIAGELADAKRLRQDAAALLEDYKQKQEAALKQAQEIVASAKAEAEMFAKSAEIELKNALDKKTKMSLERIAQAEQKALQEVQDHVVDIALSAARVVIGDHLSRSGNDVLVKQAAGELARKLN